MKKYVSKNRILTFLLLIIPSLIIVSWVNVFIGNADYRLSNYLLTFILPAIVFDALVSILGAGYLTKIYRFTYKKIIFTLLALIGSLFLFSYVLTFFGFQTLFLTALIPSVTEFENAQELGRDAVDPRLTASKFYSAEFAVTVILTVIFYAIASAIFKKRRKITPIKERVSAESVKKTAGKVKVSKAQKGAVTKTSNVKEEKKKPSKSTDKTPMPKKSEAKVEKKIITSLKAKPGKKKTKKKKKK